jgi:nucleoside-diphosphate-sugar epimerase
MMVNDMTKHLFCFGLGYTTNYLKAILPGWKVSGTHSSFNRCSMNEYLFNENNNISIDKLNDVTHILISIPPTEEGDLAFLRFSKYLENLKSLKWIGYFSSTSVYGDHDGDWVNETSKTDPTGILGKNRLLAESQWLSTNLPVVILRLAAIYGPGRSVIDRINNGNATKIFKEGHYFSRIYVKDIALIIKHMMENPKTHEIYNLADDLPCSQHELIDFACDLMKIKSLPLINFEEAEISAQMKNYYMLNKRIDNNKLKIHYGIKLNFPSYKDGIADLFNEEKK